MELQALPSFSISSSVSRVQQERDVGERFDLGIQSTELSTHNSKPSTQDSDSRTHQAREAAGQLVASAFLIPYLASIRETSFAEGPFAPNIVERRFGPVMDQHVADQIMQSTNFDLIDTIVHQYPELSGSNAKAKLTEQLAAHTEHAGREWTA